MGRQDVQRMQAWYPYRDPLHSLWHLPRSAPMSRDVWAMLHNSGPTRMWFAIERRADNQLIGALSLREITTPTSGRLGIRLAPDYVDQGYGSEALGCFLPYYFQTLGLAKLILDVAATNQRAIHVYEKLGFRRTGHHYRNIPKGHSLDFLEKGKYRDLRRYFRRSFGRMQLLFYDMELRRNDWEKRVQDPA
jgi:diamine N-acetyltransferase